MRRILVVEDDSESLETIRKCFSDSGVDVLACATKDQAIKAIDGGVCFDAVILDWYFESPEMGDPDLISRLLLKKLNGNHFRPVFVYTSNISDFTQAADLDGAFPQNLLRGVDKTNVQAPALKGAINEMLQSNLSLQLASAYRETIGSNLERILFGLNELPNADLAMVLKKIVGENENIDWSNDFILNLIHRQLLSDAGFVSELKAVLGRASGAPGASGETDKRSLVNKILYFTAVSDYIRNGDIVSLVKDGADKLIGVVTTPDCDLDQKYTKFIELIELRPIDDTELALTAGQKENIRKFNHPSLYLFPSLLYKGVLQDFVAVLKSKKILQEVCDTVSGKYPAASKRLLYSQEFFFNAEKVKLSLLCGKANPYKSEFFQKLNVNNTRVGIPEIKELF